MASKPINVSVKNQDTIKAALELVIGQVEKLRLPAAVKELLLKNLALVMALLFRFSEPVKDPSNSDLPTGKGGRPRIQPAEPRKKGERKPGGQKGHKGRTHEPEEPTEPDTMLYPKGCEGDPNWEIVDMKKHQTVDVVAVKRVRNYVAVTMRHKVTGEIRSARFPDNAKSRFQYGEWISRKIAYESLCQMIPFKRLADGMGDRLGIRISEGTAVNIVRRFLRSKVLDDFMEAARKVIRNAPVVNADETSVSLKGVRHWVHVAIAMGYFTLHFHRKRGKEGMDDAGILPEAIGVLVHDCWQAYFQYVNNDHALCNTHFIRELRRAQENGCAWADPMIALLLKIKLEVEAVGAPLPAARQRANRRKYRQIIAEGMEETGGQELKREPWQVGRRGRIAKTPGRNLLERMGKRIDEVLRFMTDPNVPFTNNIAERALRMLKLKGKISGCIRNDEMAGRWCLFMGYRASCAHHGIGEWEAISMLAEERTPQFIRDKLTENVQAAA
jgi:transposase